MGYVPGSVAQVRPKVKHTHKVPVTSCNRRLPVTGTFRQGRGPPTWSRGYLFRCLDLGVDLFITQVDCRDTDPTNLPEEGYAIHPSQLRRFA